MLRTQFVSDTSCIFSFIPPNNSSMWANIFRSFLESESESQLVNLLPSLNFLNNGILSKSILFALLGWRHSAFLTQNLLKLFTFVSPVFSKCDTFSSTVVILLLTELSCCRFQLLLNFWQKCLPPVVHFWHNCFLHFSISSSRSFLSLR